MTEIDQILAQCTNILPGYGPERSLKQKLQFLADALTGDEDMDDYGEGEYLSAFEAEVAALFGKEAAVFMPSGTMAQQIALRVWCERRHNHTVAMHPSAHPEFAEHSGFRFLHGLQRLQFGAPEFVGNRLLTVEDFEALGETPGAVLLELPHRPLGGQLPPWEDLQAMRAWAQARNVPLHMDGARVWQCRPFYGKSYAEIASLFDSVYLSFYKDLGGLTGAMLLGTADYVKEARVWQVRHGGRLHTMAPFVVSARLGFQRVPAVIDQWVARAREVAAVLSQFDEVMINPDPPHASFFQLYVRGDPATLTRRHMELARETGTFLFYRLGPSGVPGLATTEMHFHWNAMSFDVGALAPFMERLLAKPAH
jgi:threonine aldolase